MRRTTPDPIWIRRVVRIVGATTRIVGEGPITVFAAEYGEVQFDWEDFVYGIRVRIPHFARGDDVSLWIKALRSKIRSMREW